MSSSEFDPYTTEQLKEQAKSEQQIHKEQVQADKAAKLADAEAKLKARNIKAMRPEEEKADADQAEFEERRQQ